MDAMNDLKWLIFVMIALWVVWFYTGGPESERARGGLFLRPPAPLDTGETYGELPEISIKKTKNIEAKNDTASVFQNKVLISSTTGANESEPNVEYIELKAELTNNSPVSISGWSVKNMNGEKLMIGQASELPLMGKVNTETALFLSPGESAIITTGRSPIGVSFRINSCSGFFEEFQDFNPSLDLSCPAPEHIAKIYGTVDYACITFISTINTCTMYINEIPADLSEECRRIVRNKINYNGCVEAYERRSDFYKPTWRIFLGSNKEFWNNKSDLIRLYDDSGNLVHSKSY